jgi:hypothetical protein
MTLCSLSLGATYSACPKKSWISKGEMAKKVQINTQAPEFSLQDFQGNIVRLSDYQGHKHVVLIFNRGFT